MQIGLLTIPKMHESRMDSLTSGINFETIWNNIYSLFILQDDGTKHNVIAMYGCLYVISLPFFIGGLILTLKRRNRYDFIMITAFVSAFLLLIIYSSANINRVNALYITMVYFIAVGIGAIMKNRVTFGAVACAYMLLFAGFCTRYFGQDYRETMENNFYASFGEAIVKAEEVADAEETIYITGAANMPYIYVLFYNKIPPADYYNTAVFANRGAFESVSSFDRYIIGAYAPDEKAVFVLSNSELDFYDTTNADIYVYDRYSVVVQK